MNLHEQLTADLEAGIRVLRDRDKIPLTDEQIEERATNMLAALLGNYSIVPFAPLGAPPDWETPLISGRPVGHLESCQCTPCHTEKFNRRTS